jgi:hypothetical protein
MDLEQVIIRELEKNDIEKLVQFVSSVYGYKETDFKFFCDFYNWKYINNRMLYPNGTGSLVAISGDKIVGFVGAINYYLRTNDGLRNAVWSTDWMRDKEHSPGGLGKLMLKKLIENKNNVLVTNTEIGNTKSVLVKFGFNSENVGIHSYCYLNIRAIEKVYSRKGLWILFSILLQHINQLIFSWHRLVFADVELNELNFPANVSQGLTVDDDYLHWIAQSPAFSGKFYNIIHRQKNVGYLIVQPFEKNGLSHVRILDYSISEKLGFLFLQKIKQFYKDFDIINIKHPKKMKLKSFISGFYNSTASFWYPREIHNKLNFIGFYVSYLEKDAAFRGVNNIV